VLHTQYHQALLSKRTVLTYDEYESFYTFQYVEDGGRQDIPVFSTGAFRLVALDQHKRIYEKVEQVAEKQVTEHVAA
jgi:hydroxymethylglutaryl-CoA synthase